MKHLKGWLIFWVIFETLCFFGFLGVGIYWGIYKEIIIAGFYFWLFASIWLACAIKDICELVRHNWIDEKALAELSLEDIEKRKKQLTLQYFKKRVSQIHNRKLRWDTMKHLGEIDDQGIEEEEQIIEEFENVMKEYFRKEWDFRND